MAETRAIDELTPEIWDDQFTVETYQKNPFARYMGMGSSKIIRVKEDFASKRGNGISFEFLSQLDKTAITGRTPLKGNEDVLGEYGDKVFWDRRKKGIAMHEIDEELAAIDLRRGSRTVLRDWADNDIKFQVIDRMLDVGADLDVAYDDADASTKNAWTVTQADRVLFGSSTANYSATHASGLLNVNNTADQGKYGKTAIGVMKRMAVLANPRITPVRTEGDDREWFVAFVHPYTFRDIKAHLESVRAQVQLVEQNEGIFSGGDLKYDGVVIHEVQDMPVIAGAGGSGIDLAPVYFCGQEALGYGVKSRYKTREDVDNYGEIKGLGMFADFGIKKLAWRFGPNTAFHGKQRGVLTGFASAVGD